jgi:hypothetical protein
LFLSDACKIDITRKSCKTRRARPHVPSPRFLFVHAWWVSVQFITGFKIRIRADARRSSSRFRQSDSGYSATGDLGLHHGLDGLFALACDANGELIERGHHGVMATEQTCQRRAASEVQVLQIDTSFNSFDVWNAQQQSEIIMG